MKIPRLWSDRTEEYRPLLKKIKRLFPSLVGHVPLEAIFMCSFIARKSRHVARIRPVRNPWALLVPRDVCYVIEFWEQRFEDMDEANRLYVMLHELIHIPELGFEEGSPSYRKTVDHDLQDFKFLRSSYGVRLQKVQRILKGEKLLKGSL